MGEGRGGFELNIGSSPFGFPGGDGGSNDDGPMVQDAEPVKPVREEDEFFPEREREEFKAKPSYFLLLGRQGVGKSSFINMMAQSQKAPARKGTENTTTTMRPYQLSKNVGLVDVPGFGVKDYRPADLWKTLQKELVNKPINGVIILEESNNLRVSPQIMFILEALKDSHSYVEVESNSKMPVFWENVFWVATKSDLQSSRDLGKWSDEINKVFKVNSEKNNFFSVGRDGSGDL